MYTHVLDQHGIVYNQPIVLNKRQAGVAMEGVSRPTRTGFMSIYDRFLVRTLLHLGGMLRLTSARF